MIRRRKKKGKLSNYLVLVCEQKDAKRVIDTLLINQYSPIKLSGVILADITKNSQDYESLPNTISKIPIVAVQDDMMDYLRTHVVDNVLIHLKTQDVTELAKQLVIMGINVHVKINQVFDEQLKCTAEKDQWNFGLDNPR